MKILIISDDFYPEVNAVAQRMYERACYWASMGCEVTVITCVPNAPHGMIYPGYKNRWRSNEEIKGIKVIRVKTFIAPRRGIFLRLIDHLSFMFMSFLAGIKEEKPDIVFATSPQFFTLTTGWLLARIKNKPLIIEIADLWPASIVAVKLMKENFLYRLIEKWELFLYRKAEAIIALTQYIKRDIASRGIDLNKIFTIKNGVDQNEPKNPKKVLEIQRQHLLENKFVIGYIGNHGLANALHRVLEAAKHLESIPVIHFLFVGDGATRDMLINQAREMAVNNITFLPLQSRELIDQYWYSCDLALVHLRDHPIFSGALPLKLFKAVSVGLPVILCSPKGEASDLVQQNRIGVWIAPENPLALANAIIELFNNRSLLKEYAMNSKLIASNHTRQRQAIEVLSLMSALSTQS